MGQIYSMKLPEQTAHGYCSGIIKAGPIDYVMVEESLNCLKRFYKHITLRLDEIATNCELFKEQATSLGLFSAARYGLHMLYKTVFSTTSESLRKEAMDKLAQLHTEKDTLSIRSIKNDEERKNAHINIIHYMQRIKDTYATFVSMPSIACEFAYLENYKESVDKVEAYLIQI